MAPKQSIKTLNKQFESGINTRGQAKLDKKNKKDNSKPTISPTLVGLLIFIICGSAVIGLLQTLLQSYLTPAPSYEVTPEMLEQYRQQQEAQGFGNLSDYPLSDVYTSGDDATIEPIAVTPEVVNLDENEVENE